jgi:hypothetical protein
MTSITTTSSLLRTKPLVAAAALGLLALFGNAAHAQATTDSLAGWSVYGDAVSQSGAITLTTAYLDGDSDQPANLSGTSAVDIGTLESAAGVGLYGLDLSAEQYGTEGSLIGQTFAATAGQTLSFDWSFSTLDTQFQDRAFVVIDGAVVSLATAGAPGTATQSFNYTFAQSGTKTLSFGVIDTVDVVGVSSLSVSNLQLVSAVPEPASTAMMLAGLVLVGVVKARSRRRDYRL